MVDANEELADAGSYLGGGDAFVSPETAAYIDRKVEEKLDALAQRPEPLMRVADVARYLRVSARTVETLIAEGAIQPLWVRGCRRFTKVAVDGYLRTTAAKKTA